ncbi:type II toxin-antitoxin system Phd/YefM family antitoxin [Streptomyces sp. NPDC057621]|uniref:type II toxin-antitoxin system Phd/YefM family antitoxin n=1 Tax=Streptomyces sp. NPDC057621 TaxID=3346186 RepID=UPI00367FF31F
MQRTYKTREMQTKAKEILDAAEAGDDVQIIRNGRVFRVVPDEAEQVERSEPVGHATTDDLLAQLVEQTDLLRRLVADSSGATPDNLIEQARSQAAEVVDSGVVTVRIDEEPQERPVVVIPEAAPAKEPEISPEPSQRELEAACDYFGLRSTPDGYRLELRGLQSASGTVRKKAKEDPESAEAKVMRMGSTEEGRVEFLLCVQIDKLSRALAKRAAGDPRWLGAATP